VDDDVIAHRVGKDDGPRRDDPRHRQRQDDPEDRLQGRRPESDGRLDVAPVDGGQDGGDDERRERNPVEDEYQQHAVIGVHDLQRKREIRIPDDRPQDHIDQAVIPRYGDHRNHEDVIRNDVGNDQQRREQAAERKFPVIEIDGQRRADDQADEGIEAGEYQRIVEFLQVAGNEDLSIELQRKIGEEE